VVDEYYQIREQRLELAREVERLEESERGLKQMIMNYMEENHAHVIGGALCTVRLKITPKPVAKDWAQIWEYVKTHDAPEIYYRRLNERSITERREQGEEIPGVEWFPTASLSVSKGPNNG
jgi:hypothetical protein